jgi:iron complex outermembrane receptor protein
MNFLIGSSALALSLAWANLASAQTADPVADVTEQTPAAQSPTPSSIDTNAADDAAADTSGEIVVTAQRRSESAQRVPISLTALDAGKLEDTGVRSVLDLQRVVPSFSIQKANQVANTRLAIRGIGSSGNTAIEPSVGAFVDGVYVARPGSLLAGLNDVSAVEVLRGPQGTLFGRNASMGAVSFHTTLPKPDFEVDAGAEYGSFDRKRFTGIVNVPVNDTIAVRVAGLYDGNEGFGRDLFAGRRFGGSRLKSVRGTILAKITPALTWTIRGDYQRVDGDGQSVITVLSNTVSASARANLTTRLRGQIPFLDKSYSRDVFQYTEGLLKDNQYGFSSDLNLDLGGYSLKLLSAYRNWSNRQYDRDATNTPADIFSRDATFKSKTHSEELQLTSPSDLLDNRLSFVAGLYYFHEDYSIAEVLNFGSGYCSTFIAQSAPTRLAACNAGPKAPASTFAFNQPTTSYAGYSQATFNLTDKLHLTGGIRYSHDRKTGDLASLVFNSANIFRVADTANGLRFSGGKVTYRANASYDLTRDIMLFATYATGYKSGGFDSGNGARLGLDRVFRPETTTNYEAGIKSQFFARRLTANATLFRTDINDFQLRSYNGTAFSVRNAGSIRQQGVEFELTTRPMRGLNLGVTGTYLDSKYTDFRNAPALPAFTGVQDLTGRRAPTSPKWQGNLSGSYEGTLSSVAEMRWKLSSNLSFQSSSDVGISGDANPQGVQPGYSLIGARLSILGREDRWEAYLAGDNLADKRYCNVIYTQGPAALLGLTDPTTGGSLQRCVLGEPQTVRIGVKVKFR